MEPGTQNCQIDGIGSYKDQSFQGPGEFGQLVSKHDETIACATKQLFEFFIGRKSTSEDADTLLALRGQYQLTPQYQSMILAFIETEAIMYKKGQL